MFPMKKRPSDVSMQTGDSPVGMQTGGGLQGILPSSNISIGQSPPQIPIGIQTGGPQIPSVGPSPKVTMNMGAPQTPINMGMSPPQEPVGMQSQGIQAPGAMNQPRRIFNGYDTSQNSNNYNDLMGYYRQMLGSRMRF
jgi:hypothetical protein